MLGGMLVQDADAEIEDRDGWEVASGEVERGAVERPRLRVARVQARLLERDRAGEGPRDDRDRRRPDEPRRRRAHRGGEGARSSATTSTGAALASDAFFPFADGPQIALDAGVTAIVQPGGSQRDDEVVAAASAAGAAMVFTGRRHFRH